MGYSSDDYAFIDGDYAGVLSFGFMKILVTDDDPDGAFVTQLLLERLGHEVIVAHDGATALQQASVCSPDLVLLDINLPDIDGFKVCAEMRKYPALKDTPIFAFTGFESPAVIPEAHAAGFSDVLIKSFDFENVRKRIASLEAANKK